MRVQACDGEEGERRKKGKKEGEKIFM